MSDIRSFFGGGGTTSSKTASGNKPPPPKPTKKASQSPKKTPTDPNVHADGGPKVIIEKKGAQKPSGPSAPAGSGASSSKHFNGSNGSAAKGKMAPARTPGSASGSSKKAALVIDSGDSDSDVQMLDAPQTAKKPSPAKAKPRPSGSAKKRKKVEDSSSDGEEESDEAVAKPKTASASKGKAKARPSAGKRTKEDDDFIDDEDVDVKPKKKPPPKKSAKPPPKKAKVENDATDEEDAGPPAPKPKPKWIPKERSGPAAPGSKEIPEGEPDCLAGLTFVFTGELESLGRDEIANLAKRYGARVTSGPSSKTSFVVVGKEPGPKKMETIRKQNLKVLDEDGFLALIASRGSGDVDEKTIKKREEEEKKVRENAKNMGPKAGSQAEKAAKDLLWTAKYAPTKINEICGNKGQVEKLQYWLANWHANRKKLFKAPGKDGSGLYRAVVIYGAPGVGKTTAAHLVAKLEGFDPIELNASDTRSKKLLQAELSNTTGQTGISSFFKGQEDAAPDNIVLIMDEVDGMSAGDRGGVGALCALIKKTQVPIICIANDVTTPKMKPFKNAGFMLQFKRPEVALIRSRMLSIAFREKLKIPANVIDQLVAGTQADIRQIINMMSTYKLTADAMNFDEGKALAKINEKAMITSPWTLTSKLFSAQTWSANNNISLNEKNDLYFVDAEMLPMFVQDNYLKYAPARAKNEFGPMNALKTLQLMSDAADAIADGDLVSGMIRGPQQHWSLMPLHGIFSCVLPASYCYGTSTGYGGGGGWGGGGGEGRGGMAFPMWFGKNSSQTKLQRLLGEIQIRMRLKVSGDRKEIRQSYLPVLYPKLYDPLVEEGDAAIEQVIELMDEYYLTKDEWDAIIEIFAMGDASVDDLMKRIPTKVKASFTRQYNKGPHPIPFHKASDLGAKAQKKLAADAPAPDLEEAFEVEADVGSEEEGGDDDSENGDVTKDKLIKNKAKPAPKAKAKGK